MNVDVRSEEKKSIIREPYFLTHPLSLFFFFYLIVTQPHAEYNVCIPTFFFLSRKRELSGILYRRVYAIEGAETRVKPSLCLTSTRRDLLWKKKIYPREFFATVKKTSRALYVAREKFARKYHQSVIVYHQLPINFQRFRSQFHYFWASLSRKLVSR